MTAKKEVGWVITVDEAHQDVLNDLVEQLTDCGLRVERVLVALGQITGHADPECADRMAAVAGVSSVIAATEFRAAPPDAEIQ